MLNDKLISLFGAILVLLHLHFSLAITLREEMFLTDEQQLSFNRFKEAALNLISTGYMRQDLVLIKYFRSCDMNENKTLALLKDNLKWRLDLGFEALTEDELNNYERLYPYSTFKDKLGRGVFFLAGKYWDIANASSTPTLAAKFTQFVFHIYEEAYIKGVSNSTNRTASGIVLTIDARDTDLTKNFCPPCLKLLKDIGSQFEIRWPGGMQGGYMMNVPSLIGPMAVVLKKVLPKNLQESTFIYDENDAVWMPELLKFIDIKRIPQELYVRSQQQVEQVAGSKPKFPLPFPPPPPMMPGPTQVKK